MKGMLKRIDIYSFLSLFVCGAMLCGLTGCAGDPASSGITDTTTAATTTTVATTTSEAPMTTTTTKDSLEIGGKTFTLDGETFEMGVSPEKLLTHLGSPNEAKDEPDPADGRINHFYYYDDIIVVATVPIGQTDIVISDVYFPTNHYSFDGISVGKTVEELDEKISPKIKPSKERHIFSTLYGGVAYVYEDGENDVRWFMFFNEPEEPYIDGEVNILPGSLIQCIKISYFTN